MHDLKSIVNNPELFDFEMRRRGAPMVSKQILELDQKRRKFIRQLDSLRSEHNKLSSGGVRKENCELMTQKVRLIKEEEIRVKSILEDIHKSLHDILAYLPNILANDISDGIDQSDNVVIKECGYIEKKNFSIKSHEEISVSCGFMDLKSAASMSGSRFSILKNRLAKMERSLIDWMLDVHTERHGYEEISPPILIKSDALFATGQLPKFSEDSFSTQNDLWLIPTSEVSLTNIVRDSRLFEKELPKRFTASTVCFRKEAGASGKDTRGIIRQHQFYKVELVSIVSPENGEHELDRMIDCVENILKDLGLAYRIVKLCAGETGFSSKKTYDFEVWFPYQKKYREISSCSWVGDFQARRMNARWVGSGNRKGFVHTLNGSGVAIGRCIAAILENFQESDGRIRIPSVLAPWMSGQFL